METILLSTVDTYSVSVDSRYDPPLSQLSLSSFSSIPATVSFLVVRETLISYATDGDGVVFRRAVEDGSNIEFSATSFDARCGDTEGDEFYREVFRSIEEMGVEPDDISPLVDSIIDAAGKKLSEGNPYQNFTELLVAVYINRTHFIAEVDASTDVETAMSESWEEDEEENNGMVPASEKARETMLKSIVVAGEEGSGRQPEGKDSSDCRSGDQVNTVGCVICLEDIPAGSRAAQAPCSHVFHRGCLAEWLGVSHFCPICRFEFPAQQ